MNIPARLKTYLANSHGHFKGRLSIAGDSFEKSVTLAGIPLHKTVKAVMLKSGKASLMALVRGDQQVDISVINRLFKREFTLCDEGEIHRLMPECGVQALPPLAEPYGLRAIMDSSIVGMDKVYFASGVAGLFIRASGEDFIRLQQQSWKSYSIAVEQTTVMSAEPSREIMRKQVQTVNDLPAMPGLAIELIRIRNNPFAHASELAAIIEQDPSLTAQLLRYANASAPQERIESVEQAIVRGLGMDFVLDIAFGLSLGRAFNNPKNGPLGLDNFWRHSLYCAALTQTLCNAIEFTRRPSVGMGYLAGLLHNFGILLLGHLFPAQFDRLNSAVEKAPGHSILELERESIGVSHTEMGLWLMEAWDMPKAISEAVIGHHNPAHSGDFSTYANLVYIANALLKRHGIGEGADMVIPPELPARFGLSEAQLEAALASVLQGREELEFMAARMAA
ncbi:MAG: HDOD domain-containing protein [Gammaproteobacteria bacterium]|nr:HDOD domain-containing protein [Gammaproteobacteria bacterium]MCW8959834.1 HDOD domain-containing protein [Gammaproteobacteria bacterium]MCW8972854.1 HDOD domain-containing protein [Gammaproteobacteria bacterium]MCW8992073.1 HDOD domain-containing protein [Gammaproteobacteria bacterium]MCW9089622.1 HDOD domain-containing protein [Gammaproteobacteria bacterium]